jgi:large subunit ribosomal protein L6
MVEGVTKGFEKELEIVGVGYRVEKVGDNLKFSLGFSHPVEVLPLPGISFTVEAANRVKVSGIDKQVVGQMAAEIRAVRPPDAYKGKGVRYLHELVKLKSGKAK